MSSQLLNGPFGLALVLTPPGTRGRLRAASVIGGILPSGGSTTSHARLFLRSKVSKMRCAGGRRPPANSSPLTPSTKRSLRSVTIRFSSSAVRLSCERPSSDAGRSIGVPVSSSLE